jgi:cell division protein FtsW
MSYRATTKNKRLLAKTKANGTKRATSRKPRKLKVSHNVNTSMKPRQMDYAIFFTVIMLVIFGVVMVFSASYFYAMTHAGFSGKFHFVKRQGLWAIIGFGAMLFMTFFDYRKIKKYSVLAYIAANILLVLVLIMGAVSNGSQRWIAGFQPSELSKLAVIIFLAYFIDKNPRVATTFKGFVVCMMIVGIPAILIAVQNLSTAIVVTGIGVIVIFISGAKAWYYMIMAVPGGVLGAAMLLPEKYAYRRKRIDAWIDPFSDPMNKGYQTIQSLYAIASGGLFGRGLGNSLQKLGYIPEAYNDIIFSIVCEELGLIGAGALILLFIILIWRGIKVALNARDLFASLVATGITSMVAIQVMINIAVATNTIPNTGMPLPFISYGGSSLSVLMVSMGILLNISCYTKAQ